MNIMTDMFAQAVAAGQNDQNPQSPLPTDERSGPWATPLAPDTDPARDPLNAEPVGNQVANRPAPIIGTIPFGGVVVQTGQIVDLATIGDNSHTRLGVLGILLTGGDSASAELLPDGAGYGYLGAGLSLGDVLAGSRLVWLPVRSATIRVQSGMVSYAVIASDAVQTA